MVNMLCLRWVMVVVVGLWGVVGSGGAVQAEELTVGAAPSLKAAFKEIVPLFEREYGAAVHVVYGPSQTLRREIEKGASIDVFLPASAEEIRTLEKKGLTRNGGVRLYGQTSLVLVMSSASRATSVSFRDVLPNRGTRIALGDPKQSALGAITVRSLAKLDPEYRDRVNLLFAQHNEDVVSLVQEGVADVGIVYRVDAISNGQVRIIDEAPTGTHTPVFFGGAVVWTCRKESLKVAEDFTNFVASPRIQKLLLKYGFEPVAAEVSRG